MRGTSPRRRVWRVWTYSNTPREELVGDLRDDPAPRTVLAREALVVDRLQSVQVIRHQPKERRRLRASGLVHGARRRYRVGHARSGTEERRAYALYDLALLQPALRADAQALRSLGDVRSGTSGWSGADRRAAMRAPGDSLAAVMTPPRAEHGTPSPIVSYSFMRLNLVFLLTVLGCRAAAPDAAPATVVPNDNRVASGTFRRDTLVFTLNARLAAWRPDSDVDSAVTVQAFASRDGVPRIPGPLLRVSAGTVVEIRVTNSLADSTLVVHGLRPGTRGDDTLQVKAGESRLTHFVASTPGTFLYWGRSSGDRMQRSERRDGLLTGAIVVDAAGVQPDTSERVS